MQHPSIPFSRSDMRADIARLLRIDPAEVAGDADLADLGLDSLRTMDLMVQWERAGLRMDFARMAEALTLDAWWAVACDTPGGPAHG